MTILVTGATGTVGSQVVDQLVKRGADVRALVRDPSKVKLPAGVSVVQGDMLDVDSLRSAFSGVSTLFLLNAVVSQSVLGVAVGIAIADLIVSALGTSTPVLMLVVALSMGAALLLGGSTILISQAGVSAIFVTTVEQPHGFTPNRFIDALIGGTVALLVSQVLLPRDPVASVTEQRPRAERPARPRLARDGGGAARRATATGPAARSTIARSAGTNLEDFADAVDIARETVSVRPPVWRARERLPLYADAVAQLDLAVRNARVLARRAVSAIRRHGPAPPELADAVDRLAEALDELVHHLDDPDAETASRRIALDAARGATAVLERDRSMSTSALVAQVRSTAVDLLRGSGLTEDEAIAELERIEPVAGASQRLAGRADRRYVAAMSSSPWPASTPSARRCAIVRIIGRSTPGRVGGLLDQRGVLGREAQAEIHPGT